MSTLTELADQLQNEFRGFPRALTIAAEMRSIEAQPQSVKPHTGTGALTRDLVWCECGRGLSTTGIWAYCPRCGHPIDQVAYRAACDEATRLRGFEVEGDEFLRDKIAIAAAESAPVPESAGLVEALRKLTAECQGFLSMADPETHGYTNTAVLRQRLEISRAAIAAYESRNSGAAQKAEEA